MANKEVKAKAELLEFVKPNGTVMKVNEEAAVHAANLGWLPRADYEKLLAEQAKAEKDAKAKQAKAEK